MKRWFLGLGALALVLLFVSTRTCLSTGFRYGLWLDECPDGELRQTIFVSAPAVTRGGESSVSVEVMAHYTTGNADARESVALTSFSVKLSLLGGPEPIKLEPKTQWVNIGTSAVALITLPKVNDGEYRLHAEVSSKLGTSELDVPMPLYAPARVHVLTDRPLYEPGNTVKFRALALRASDLSPLDERPGTWLVTDPSGETLLEERALSSCAFTELEPKRVGESPVVGNDLAHRIGTLAPLRPSPGRGVTQAASEPGSACLAPNGCPP